MKFNLLMAVALTAVSADVARTVENAGEEIEDRLDEAKEEFEEGVDEARRNPHSPMNQILRKLHHMKMKFRRFAKNSEGLGSPQFDRVAD